MANAFTAGRQQLAQQQERAKAREQATAPIACKVIVARSGKRQSIVGVALSQAGAVELITTLRLESAVSPDAEPVEHFTVDAKFLAR